MVFLVPVFLLLFLLETTLRTIPNDYSYKRKYLEKHADEIEILVLGSSHSLYGVNPEFLSMNAFNASNVSQSPKFDLFIFSKFQSDFSKLQFVILPISYFTLFSSTDSGIEKWREKNYVIYYDYPDGSFSSHLELMNGKIRQNVKSIKDWLLNDKTNKACSKYGYGLKLSDVKQFDLDETAFSALKRHTAENYKFLEENKDYIERLISECLEKNIQIILYTPPAWSTYTEHLNQRQLQITRSFCQKITKKYTNAHYFDLLTDKRFVKGDFRDADHTNHKGSEKLTLILNRILEM